MNKLPELFGAWMRSKNVIAQPYFLDLLCLGLSHRGDIQIETGSFIIFVGVLLAIPLFLGRAFHRALETRKRIEEEVGELTYASARIIGFTKKSTWSESDVFEHFAIVEYETPENEVIWAKT